MVSHHTANHVVYSTACTIQLTWYNTESMDYHIPYTLSHGKTITTICPMPLQEKDIAMASLRVRAAVIGTQLKAFSAHMASALQPMQEDELITREAHASSAIEGITPLMGREYKNHVHVAKVAWQDLLYRGFEWSFAQLHEYQALLKQGLGEQESGKLRSRVVGIHRATDIYFPVAPGIHLEQAITSLATWAQDAHTQGGLDLVDIACFHVQFERIHPYEDGNGRIGRLALWLQLSSEGFLTGPYLPISEAIMQARPRYYETLTVASDTGNYAPFVEFFLDCIETQLQVVQADTIL